MTRRERNMRAQRIVECEDCGRLCQLPTPESGLIWLGWCMPCAFNNHSREEKGKRAWVARQAVLRGCPQCGTVHQTMTIRCA